MINTHIKFINPVEIKFSKSLNDSIKQIHENSTLLVQQFKEQQKTMVKQFMDTITLQMEGIAVRARVWQKEQGLKVSSMG